MKLASDPKNVDKVPPPLKAAHMFASHSVFLYLLLSSRVLHLGFGGCVGMPGMPIGLTQLPLSTAAATPGETNL